jgi:mannitol/fructose-specific phosphotransferase system IIA component
MSQVGRKTTIILDEDMYRLILGYAIDNYGTVRAISRVINDIIRERFSSERKSQLDRQLDKLLPEVDRLYDEVNKLNRVLSNLIDAINHIKMDVMSCKCQSIESIDKLSSQLSQFAKIGSIVDELRELVTAIYSIGQESVMIYKTHEKANYIAGIIDRIKDMPTIMNNILMVSHNTNRRTIKFEDVTASIIDALSELVKSAIQDENTRKQLLNKLAQAKSEVLRTIEFG